MTGRGAHLAPSAFPSLVLLLHFPSFVLAYNFEIEQGQMTCKISLTPTPKVKHMPEDIHERRG
jgi:hypothetical protein